MSREECGAGKKLTIRAEEEEEGSFDHTKRCCAKNVRIIIPNKNMESVCHHLEGCVTNTDPPQSSL